MAAVKAEKIQEEVSNWVIQYANFKLFKRVSCATQMKDGLSDAKDKVQKMGENAAETIEESRLKVKEKIDNNGEKLEKVSKIVVNQSVQ